MKLAILSDIHANLPALEAVLADIDQQSPDAVFCLGDLVSYAPWPNEVIHLIRQRRIPTILGNHDFDLSQLTPGQVLPTVPPDHKKWVGAQSLAFTHASLGDEERAFLGSLPRHLRLEFDRPQGRNDLLLVHGSPASLTEYVLADRSDDDLHQVLDEAGADGLLCGHSHLPFHRRLSARTTSDPLYRHVINTGSVGKPKDGDPRAGYVLLDWISNTLTISPIRVEYDVERAALAIEESALPNELADRLRYAY